MKQKPITIEEFSEMQLSPINLENFKNWMCHEFQKDRPKKSLIADFANFKVHNHMGEVVFDNAATLRTDHESNSFPHVLFDEQGHAILTISKIT